MYPEWDKVPDVSCEEDSTWRGGAGGGWSFQHSPGKNRVLMFPYMFGHMCTNKEKRTGGEKNRESEIKVFVQWGQKLWLESKFFFPLLQPHYQEEDYIKMMGRWAHLRSDSLKMTSCETDVFFFFFFFLFTWQHCRPLFVATFHIKFCFDQEAVLCLQGGAPSEQMLAANKKK